MTTLYHLCTIVPIGSTAPISHFTFTLSLSKLHTTSEGTTPLGRTSARRRRAALNTHTLSCTIRQETRSLLHVFLALNNLARVEQERSYSLLNSF